MWHGVTCTFIKFLLLLPALLFKNRSSAPAWSVPAACALLLLPHAQRQREPQQIPFTGQTGVSCTTGKPAACPNVGCSRLFPASTSAQFRPAGTPPGPASQPGPAAEEELREARKHSPLGCTAGVRLARPLALPTAAPAGCCVSPRYLPGTQFFCSAGAVIPCYTKGWMCLLSITVTGPFSVWDALEESTDYEVHPNEQTREDQVLLKVAVLWPRKWVALLPLVKINSWWRENEWLDVEESSLIHFNIL